MACVERIKQLEQENKKLKENYAKLDKVASENVRTLDELEAKRIELEEENKRLEEENKKLKEDVDYFRQCYLDLKKLCEKEWFMLSDEEVAKMLDLDKIK